MTNGPLSVETLANVLRPPMSLPESSGGYKAPQDKGIIVPHFESLQYNGAHFYRIPHDPKVRARVAGGLGYPPNSSDSRSSFPRSFSIRLRQRFGRRE